MFTPAEFRRRLEDAAPEIPADLGIQFPDWAPFPAAIVDYLKLSDTDRALLLETGLPREASPFLTFGGALENLRELQPHLGQAFAPFRVLGSNGSGDLIVADERDGRVLYHNHDSGMDEVFINSSITQLAESICLFQEGMSSGWRVDFLKALAEVDHRASRDGCMWPIEYRAAAT